MGPHTGKSGAYGIMRRFFSGFIVPPDLCNLNLFTYFACKNSNHEPVHEQVYLWPNAISEFLVYFIWISHENNVDTYRKM